MLTKKFREFDSVCLVFFCDWFHDFFENKDTNFREVWTNALKQPFDKIEDSRFLHAALIPPGPSLDPVDIKVLNFLPFGSYWVLFTYIYNPQQIPNSNISSKKCDANHIKPTNVVISAQFNASFETCISINAISYFKGYVAQRDIVAGATLRFDRDCK